MKTIKVERKTAITTKGAGVVESTAKSSRSYDDAELFTAEPLEKDVFIPEGVNVALDHGWLTISTN